MEAMSRTVARMKLTGFCFVSALLFGSTAWAQQKNSVLPADIPLDVKAIYKPFQPAAEDSSTTLSVIKHLLNSHYSAVQLNDAASGRILDGYIKSLDGSRSYFTQADIQEFEQYRTKFDDQLKVGDLRTGYMMYNRLNQRVIERLVYSLKRIEQDKTDFDFTVDETLELDRSKVAWPANHAALEDLWRRQLKSSVLSLKLTDKAMPEIRELLAKRYRSQLNQVLRVTNQDVYQRFMDAVTFAFDPHTQYYVPRQAERFNIDMRLSLEGIGAVLTTEDEYTKVVSIVTGGPADKGGELHPDDKILGVAQGDSPFVDVIGWRVDDVVELVRGEKGSIVRLNVMPKGSKLETKTVSIIREKVKLEDSAAKSEIVEVEYNGSKHKIGVIDLPSFYIDFEALQKRDPNYRSSARDVDALLTKLKADKVEAIVMDLRGNGGGSLTEASALVGLFVKRGPTVQVKDADGEITPLVNPDSLTSWDGPLAVLVNRLSASASEIFAGAIQDYQRGLVLGNQTFGKGTVQELIPLEEGQMKITRSKFYRISGESTQHKGVMPTIKMPDLYDVSDDIGESSQPTALPWDTIEPSSYRPYADLRMIIPTLNNRHEARLQNDPDFVFIRAEIAEAKRQQAQNQMFLSEAKLQQERKQRDAWRLEQENKRRQAKGLNVFKDIKEMDGDVDENNANQDSSKAAPGTPGTSKKDKEAKKESDPYLVESGKILIDLIELQGNKNVAAAAR